MAIGRLGRGLNCSHPESCRSECNGGEEVCGVLFESCGDAPELFEFAEEALDEVATSIEFAIDGTLDLDAALGRDMGLATRVSDEVDDGAAVVATVGNECLGRRQSSQQVRHGGLVRRLPWRDQQPDRQSVLIDDGMDLGAQSATRTANGVIRTPFFPPAACWWARTIDESIR